MGRKLSKFVITIFLCFLVIYSSVAFCFNTAKADVNNKTTVLQDLAKDENFNINNYPVKEKDFSMDIIHLAEGSSGLVYIYVYQPSGSDNKIVAKGLSLCTKDFEHYSIGDADISSNTPLFFYYDLVLLSNKGALFKYQIKNYNYKEDSNFWTGGEFDITLDRNYEIATIYRPYQEGETPLDEEAIHSEKGLEVGKCFTVRSLLDGTSAVSVEQAEVITVTDKFVGSMRLDGGWILMSEDLDVYFVSFKTDKRVDLLLQADVHYYCNKWHKTTTFGIPEYTKLSSESKNITVNISDENTWTGSGWGNPKYKYNRVYSIGAFNSYLSDNKDYILKNTLPEPMKNHEWVLFFAEFGYTKNTSMYGSVTETYASLRDVAIMRLKFVTNGITYNLGVVDDLTTPDRIPDLILDKSEGCKEIDWEMILKLIALLVLLILLAPVLPYIFSIVITLISLPFKLIAVIINKIKKDGGSRGKKK